MLQRFLISGLVGCAIVVGAIGSAHATPSPGDRLQQTVSDPSQCPSGIALGDPDTGGFTCVDEPKISANPAPGCGVVVTAPNGDPVHIGCQDLISNNTHGPADPNEKPSDINPIVIIRRDGPQPIIHPGLPPAPPKITLLYRGSGRAVCTPQIPDGCQPDRG